MPTYVPQAQPGEGTTLSTMIASALTPLALVTELDGLGMEVDPVDTTTLTSAVKTARPLRIPAPSALSGKMWFDPNDISSQQFVWNRVNAPGPIDPFTLTFNTTDTTKPTATFSGFFTKGELTGFTDDGGNVECDFEIMPVTVITITPGVA